jgi:hypothetical protein
MWKTGVTGKVQLHLCSLVNKQTLGLDALVADPPSCPSVLVVCSVPSLANSVATELICYLFNLLDSS